MNDNKLVPQFCQAGGWHERCFAAFEHIDELWIGEIAGNSFNLINGCGCLNKNDVRPSLHVRMRTLNCALIAFDSKAICSRYENEVIILNGITHGVDLLRHLLHRNTTLVVVMATTFWILQIGRASCRDRVVQYV